MTLPAVAAQFALAHPAVATVCLGARSRSEVERNASLFAVEIPAALWVDLRAAGLLAESVPTPSPGGEPDAHAL